MLDPKVEDVIKPLVRVVMEFNDGSVIEVKSGNIQREELFTVHTDQGIVALSLVVSTAGWQPKTAAEVLVHPTPVRENVRDARKVVVHSPESVGFPAKGSGTPDKNQK